MVFNDFCCSSCEINKWFSFGLIAAIFLLSYFYARRQGPAVEADEEAAEALLKNGS